MPDGYPKIETQGSSTPFVFRYRVFNDSAVYDPLVTLGAGEGPVVPDADIIHAGVTVKVLGQSGKITIMKGVYSPRLPLCKLSYSVISELFKNDIKFAVFRSCCFSGFMKM